jgi:hypothetical protein
VEVPEIPLSYIDENGITRCVFCEEPITAEVVEVNGKKMLKTNCECSKDELTELSANYPLCIVVTDGKTYCSREV